MNTNIPAGKFKQFKGKIKEQWAKLTDEDIDHAEGSWTRFIGSIQEKYGKSREVADEEAKKFFERLS